MDMDIATSLQRVQLKLAALSVGSLVVEDFRFTFRDGVLVVLHL